LKTLKGTERWVLQDSYLVHDRETGEEAIQAVIRDITERRRAEEALAESEERYRNLMDEAPVGLCNVDIKGKITYVNRRFENVSGYSREDVVGKSGFKLGMFSQETLKYFLKRLKEILAGDPPSRMETRFKCKDGSWIWVEIESKLIKKWGLPVGFQLVSRDITNRKRAEEALQESEERYRNLMDEAPIGFCNVDIKGKITYVNRNFEDVSGYSREDVVGKNGFKLGMFSQETLKYFLKRLKEILAGEPTRHIETQFKCKDGTWMWADIESRLIKKGGLPVGFQLAARDITDRKRAEEALRESEERYRELFENANDIVYTHDLDGQLISSNRAAELATGYSRDEAKNLNIDKIVAPEYLAEARRMVERKFAEGEPTRYELEIITKDGRRLQLEVSTRLIYKDAKPVAVQGIGRDITERKRAEEALRASETRFRELANSLPETVYEADEAGNVTFVNRRGFELFGYSQEDFEKGLNILEAAAPGDRETVKRSFQRVWSGEQLGWNEYTAQRKDGTTFPVLAHTQLIRRENKVWGFRGVVIDITERKRAEEERQQLEAQIQQAQKLESLGVLAGGIAHDFNNLLMGILGYASIALKALPPASPVRDNIGQIEKAALRAADLTSQMLAYSGKGKFVAKAIDLTELVEEITRLLEVSISKKVVLKYDLERGLPAIVADPAQIRQVVMNLITNASEAIGDKSGVIRVSTGAMECDKAYLSGTYLNEELPEGFYAYVEVTDTGCGMHKETVEKIFDPFFTTKFAGRGLGLAAVLGIVRGHNGALEVDSEPGKGTTFKVLFPCTERPAVAIESGEPTIEEQLGGGTVLVVDDEEMVCSLAKEMLEQAGVTVLTAADGQEALEVFREYADEIAAVLLDMIMPRMDGEETFREIRRIKPDVRVILSSGYNEEEATERFAGKGLAGFIQKPYRAAALIAKMQEVLEP